MVLRRMMAVVAAGGMVVLGATVPSSSLAAADAPALWGSGDRPADLEEYTFPDGLPGNQDGPANAFADLSAAPGPLDADGCGVLPVGSSPTESLPTIEAGHDPDAMPTSSASFTIDSAKICDGPGGPLTLLVVSGAMLAPFEDGTIRLVFARPASDQPFGRVAIEFQADACFTIGTTAGFPGDGSEAPVYLLQAWNFDADPAVDCSSRSIAQETTTTTSSATTSSTTTTSAASDTTTTAVPGTVPAAAAAAPVNGTATYTG